MTAAQAELRSSISIWLDKSLTMLFPEAERLPGMEDCDFLAVLDDTVKRIKGFAITPWPQKWVEAMGDSNSVSGLALKVRNIYSHI